MYITRKIIAAKFLATIIQLHYESRIELDGQPVWVLSFYIVHFSSARVILEYV